MIVHEEEDSIELPSELSSAHVTSNLRTRSLSGAINHAIDEILVNRIDWGVNSSETWLALLDDDDWWEDSYLQMCENRGVNGMHQVVCGITRYDTANPEGTRLQIPTTLEVNSFLASNPHIQGSNLFVRLDAFLEAGGFDEALYSCTDRDFCIRLFERPGHLWARLNEHLVHQQEDGTALLFVDRHLVHEVTSPQAFEGIRNSNRKVRQPKLTLAVADHNVPTTDRSKGIADQDSKIQVDTLAANCKEFGIQLFGMNDKRQGIVHIIGPEQGFTQPGTVIVCGDSHTATHGAFGALAFGIGTSEVEHVLATQTLVQKKAKNFRINVNGKLPIGVTSKDVILQIIGKIGTAGGTGYVIEYAGSLISSLSVEQRMTVCNMSIEGGARAGLIEPDQKIFDYLKNKPMSPKNENWDKAIDYWKGLKTDSGAKFDKEDNLNAEEIKPMVTWGTSPQDVVTIDGKVPNPKNEKDLDKKNSIERSLKYMGLKPDTFIKDIKIDKVFIGSCTNGRIEDLREVAKILKDKKKASHVHAMVVPGSGLVKEQAEQEGLDKIFIESGFEWREPGCSMCLAMNEDKLKPEERCASTSNRNFEGRQGRGGRTHLVSPAMAAVAAISGSFDDVRKYQN